MTPRPRTRSQSGASHNSTGSQTSLLGSPPLPTAMDLEAESISLDSSAEAERLSFGSPKTAADEDSRISFSSYTGPILPESDTSFHRKLFIMQSNSCTGQIHALPHPRSGNPVLYLLDARTGNPFELMRLDRLFNSGSGDGQRSSIFCGNSVVADPGPMFLFLPVHPLFLALPFLQENASQSFVSPEEFLHQSNGHQFPALQLLTSSEKLMEALKLAADWKENDGTVKFRFNSTLLIDWLKTKFHALEKSLKAKVEGMAEEGPALKHQALGILSDYLPEPISQQLAQHLVIDEPKEAEKKLTRGIPTSSSRKRPLADPIGMLLATSPKVTTTPARKKMARTLAIASKGTQSLKAFFVASPSLKKEEEQVQALDDEIKTVKEETPSMEEEEPAETKATN